MHPAEIASGKLEKEGAAPHAGSAGRWHALHTRHQHEKAVLQALAGKGHTVFLPLYAATHFWRRRPTQVHLPLFPGYLFIRGGLDRQLQILSTPGIVGIVKAGPAAAVVPPEQIAAVYRIVENSSHVEPHSYLHSGDRVQVISGALQGLAGILIRTKGEFRLVVSLEMLGRAAAVEVDISCVQRIGLPLIGARPSRFAAIA
jgi:transcription antitermination factor NusG